MDNNANQKKTFPNIEAFYREFKEKLATLRKKQSLILKNFTQKAEAKKIDQIRKNLN